MILKPTKENIEKIKSELLKGEIIIFPTDTVFGIGCLANNNNAIKKIYKLKKRDEKKSLLLNFANITSIKKYAKLNKLETFLIKTFMPGSLSLILNTNKKNDLSLFTIQNETIGARIPKNKVLNKILKDIKIPFVSTSCNKSGEKSCLTSDDAEKIFGKKIIILENTEKLSGIPSTIIDARNKDLICIREGSLNLKEIKLKTTKQFHQ